MKNQISNKRLNYIDAARAIGIFAIVMGHTVSSGAVRQYLYSFHVPLFFFLSGLVFSVKKDFLTFLAQKAKQLLVPYVCFSLLGTAVYAILGSFVKDSLSRNVGDVPTQLFNILKGYPDANAPLWFLPTLFIILILSFGICKFSENRSKFLIPSICVFLFGFTLLERQFLKINLLPFKIDAIPHLMFFFLLGYMVKNSNITTHFGKQKNVVGIIISIALIVLGGGFAFVNGTVNYIVNDLSVPALYFLSASLSIFGIIFLCLKINGIKVITYIGRHTMAILLMHKFPIVFFQTICPVIKNMLKNNSFIAMLIATVLSIALCLIAEIVIDVIFPSVLGKPAKKKFFKRRHANTRH